MTAKGLKAERAAGETDQRPERLVAWQRRDGHGDAFARRRELHRADRDAVMREGVERCHIELLLPNASS